MTFVTFVTFVFFVFFVFRPFTEIPGSALLGEIGMSAPDLGRTPVVRRGPDIRHK